MSWGKEAKSMNIKEVLAELDELFETNQVNEIEPFLQNKLLQAKNEKDTSSMITIVNELIGFYRDMSKYDLALSYCDQVTTLMKQCGYEGSVPYATTLLNVANAKRAAGLWEDSEKNYQEVLKIYEKQIDKNDYRYASLYNNWSLLYQEQERFDAARDSLKKALSIISQYNNTQIEIATTHTNLATTLLRLGEIKEAMDHLILALSIFEEDEGKDYHYSAALSAMGDAKYLQGDLLAAADYYEHAMKHLEDHVGRTESYERIADNLKIVNAKLEEQKNAIISQNQNKEIKQPEQSMKYLQEGRNMETAEFSLEEPSEEDFEEDDYDINCEDDFERNDYEIEIDFTNEVSEDDYDEEKPAEVSEDDYDEEKPAEVSEDDYDEEKPAEVSEDDYEEEKPAEEGYEDDFADDFGHVADKQESKDTGLFLSKKGLKLSEQFYEEFGKAMIHEKFAEYENKIAVGLVGEGSECYGFDDKVSMDHDYGTGFALWVTKETYEEIGEALQKAYEELVSEHGSKIRKETPEGESRVGVCIIDDFYKRIIGFEKEPQSEYEWYQIPDGALASAINGKVFRDEEGIFSGIRKKIQHLYPEKVRLYKIAEELAKISQYGQYNYARMMIRKDYVTAKIVVAEFMKHTMKMVYLLNRTYEPYYKWQRQGMKKLAILPEIGDILDAMADMGDQRDAWGGNPTDYLSSKINTNDQIQMTIEIVAKLILEEMKLQGLATGEDTYLDHHRAEVLHLTEDILTIAKIRKMSKDRVLACIENSQKVCDPQMDDLWDSKLSEEELACVGTSEEEMKEIEITSNKDPFLSFQSEQPVEKTDSMDEIEDPMKEAQEIMNRLEEEKRSEQESWIAEANHLPEYHISEEKKQNLVDKIVLLEWKQFGEVQNEGGRADCQDNWNTFSIMRKSQYMAWTMDVLESFYRDLSEAEAAGWNLITEKYARMMESTAPDRYQELKETLPAMTEEKKNVSEQIIQIQVGWMEEFAANYPNMAGNARSIHTYEDTPYNTSYETYLRGELGTYSDETLALYGRMIVTLSKEGKNLAKIIMNHTALLYGYQSVDDAEEKLKNQ